MRMQMDSDYFPVAIGDMNPNIEIVEVEAPITIDGISITHFYLNHPAMSLAYRVSDELAVSSMRPTTSHTNTRCRRSKKTEGPQGSRIHG